MFYDNIDWFDFVLKWYKRFLLYIMLFLPPSEDIIAVLAILQCQFT